MEENNITKPYSISKRLLLQVYGVVPILLLLVIMDTWYFDFFLKDNLGLTAANAAVYVLFLEFPHIIASFVGYADGEYLKFYKKKLLIYLPTILILSFLLISVSFELAFLGYIIYTMYHSIRQQTGIAKMLTETRVHIHELWSGIAVTLGILGNLVIFSPLFFTQFTAVPAVGILTIFVVGFIAISASYLYVLPRKNLGWFYVLATSLMLILGYVFIVLGYLFFAVFIVRFVHDVSAFIFYSIHDSNRNAQVTNNMVYRLLKPTHIPLLLVTPIVGIVGAYFLQKYGVSFQHSASAIILIAVAHYYLESFMWKREALHRRQLRFRD
jgi:hypothetical protein